MAELDQDPSPGKAPSGFRIGKKPPGRMVAGARSPPPAASVSGADAFNRRGANELAGAALRPSARAGRERGPQEPCVLRHRPAAHAARSEARRASPWPAAMEPTGTSSAAGRTRRRAT
jgi:hypothetical protein